jgi:hypothetical protein
VDVDAREFTWTAVLAFVAATVITTTSCGATDSEPCTQADLSKIVAAHEARLAFKCVGQDEKCPDRKAEDARFKEEVRAWVRCDVP